MAPSIASLHVYPVKGLKGIDLASARCTERGIEHDRRWMVVDADGEFLTQRDHPRMATIWTDLSEGALVLSAPDHDPVEVPLSPEGRPPVRVRVWNSTCDAIPASGEADRFLSDCLGLPCRLVYMPESTRRYSDPRYSGGDKLVGFADGYAFLLASQASLDDLNRRLLASGKGAVPMNRFRPNLVVAGCEPYAEDGWKQLRVGDATFGAAKPCGRCQVTTTDQASGEVTGPEPLATLSTYRQSDEFGVMFAMNLVSLRTGVVRVGASVEVMQ